MSQRTRHGLLLLTISALSFTTLYAGPFVKAKAANGTMIDAVPNQVVVHYKRGQAGIRNRSVSPKKNNSLTPLGFEVLTVPAGETIDSYIETLKSNSEIESAEPNGIMHAFTAAPNDPDFSAQNSYYMGSSKLDILNAWDISQGTPTVIIAVVDTGVDLQHADLAANIISTNTAGARMFNDLNGDGDCLDAGEDCASNNPDDTNGHGTHVAGIIAAVTNNGLNMAGIARNCKILAVRVLTAVGAGSETAVADGITYAVEHGASVINLSLGGTSNSSLIEAAVNNALDHNVVVVAASGNDGGTVNYPGAIERVIAVGATDETDTIAYFSSRGNGIDLVAPGVNILSTHNGGGASNQLYDLDDNGSPQFVPADGTSFASPMVAAVAGLIRTIDPTMPVASVTRYIDFYADDLGATGFDTTYGYGRLNAFASLQAASAGIPFISHPQYPTETFPYPNPFNPTLGSPLTISLPETLGTNNIKITIFNIAGEPIKTIHGTNSWNGRNDDGNYIASGLYYYFAETDKGHVKGKLTVIK